MKRNTLIKTCRILLFVNCCVAPNTSEGSNKLSFDNIINKTLSLLKTLHNSQKPLSRTDSYLNLAKLYKKNNSLNNENDNPNLRKLPSINGINLLKDMENI